MSDEENSSPKSETVKREWSTYDANQEGPPDLLEFVDLPPVSIDYTLPIVMEETSDTKKAKELQKKLEKEAKMKKFLEKQEQQKAKAADGDSKPKAAKQDKSKAKEKTSGIEDGLLQELQNLKIGEKKPTVKLPDAYDPKYVEAAWYSWWCQVM